jgi:hypothetical protein
MAKTEKNKYIKMISKGTLILKDLSEELKSDIDIVAESIRKDWRSFESASDKLKNDITAVKELLEINGQIFQYVADDLKTNRDLCLLAISKCGDQYEFVKNKDKDDRNFIIESVTLSGFSLKYMDEKYRNDFEIAKIAINQSGYSFEFISERLRNNRELLIDSVKQLKSGYKLQYASLNLKSDKNLILELLDYVNESKWMLLHASDNIKTNKEVVLKAVRIEGSTLEFAALELQSSRDVVYEAVLQNYNSLRYAAAEILDDIEFLNKIIELPKRKFESIGYDILTYGSESVKKNREMILKIVRLDGHDFLSVIDEFRSDEQIICSAIISNGISGRIAKHIIPNENSFLKYIIKISNIATYRPEKYETNLLTTKDRVLTILSVYYDSSKEGLWLSIPEIFKNDQDIKLKIHEIEFQKM